MQQTNAKHTKLHQPLNHIAKHTKHATPATTTIQHANMKMENEIYKT